MHETMYDVQDLVMKEIKKITDSGEINDKSLCDLDKLVDIYKDISEIEGEPGVSRTSRRYRLYDDGYTNMDGSGRGRGRMMYNDGYSRGGDMYSYLEDAMNMARNDVEREKIRRFMSELNQH